MYKKISVLFFLAIFSCCSFASIADFDMAKRAHKLAVKLEKSSDKEKNVFCEFYLYEAAGSADDSGKYYMADEVELAKKYMTQVSQYLGYTVVDKCSEAATIALCKQEADEILASTMK